MQEMQPEIKYDHCGWLNVHTNVRYWFWPKTHALQVDDTEAHRSDKLMRFGNTVQAFKMWLWIPATRLW